VTTLRQGTDEHTQVIEDSNKGAENMKNRWQHSDKRGTGKQGGRNRGARGQHKQRQSHMFKHNIDKDNADKHNQRMC